MGKLNFSQADLTQKQAKALKNARPDLLKNNEQQASEFIMALEDHFQDKQTALEIAQQWNVSQNVINKHFGDYLDAVEEANADKAYNAWFWQSFYCQAFAACVENKGVVTKTELTSATESQLQKYSNAYVEEAKKQFKTMEEMTGKYGQAVYKQADYAFSNLRFQKMAEHFWMAERLLGRI